MTQPKDQPLAELINDIWRRHKVPQVGKVSPTAPTIPMRRTATRSNNAAHTVLSGAIPVGDIEDDFIQMVIYGRNRVGKTTLACEFPGPRLLVSFEPSRSGGARSVKLKKDTTYLRIVARGKPDHRGVVQDVHASEWATRLALELQQHCPFKTVVLDTVTGYQDLILAEILNLPDIPEQLNWGFVSEDEYRKRSEKTRAALRHWIDVPAHVLFLAKEKDHNPPKDRVSKVIRPAQLESFFAADVGGATCNWLHDVCDFVIQLYQDRETRDEEESHTVNGQKVTRKVTVETGKIVRRARTVYHPNFAAGFRSERPDRIPEYLEAETPAAMYAGLMNLIRGEEE
jgi:hypothetical protein